MNASSEAHAACHFASARSDILEIGQPRQAEPSALSAWPTGRPSDEQAAAPMACMPDETLQPQRLDDDVVVDAEGELVREGEPTG